MTSKARAAMKAFIILIVFGFAIPLHAQTNLPSVTTNFVKAVPWFREVDGKLYNVRLSKKFSYIHANVAEVRPDFVILTWSYESGYTHRTEWVKDIAVLNCDDKQIAEGQLFTGDAMRVGVTNFNNRVIELWDCGKPHLVPVLVTNKTENAHP